jgi:hypothetical protein
MGPSTSDRSYREILVPTVAIRRILLRRGAATALIAAGAKRGRTQHR